QAASLTLLADQQFDRTVMGVNILASQVQLLNPLFIVLFAPLIAWFWVRLSRANIEPSTPAKFAIAMVLIGLGYVIFSWGLGFNSGDGIEMNNAGKNFLWLVLIYLFLTLAELCLSPVGLSMVTKLSTTRIVGMLMGTWFLFSAMGNYVAGWISSLTGSSDPGANSGALDVAATISVYQTIGLVSIAVGVFIFVLTPMLKRRMHGVH
ncbi:MAG TPA: MFS transporter, partial [Cellvibrionales bacterium]|nr:MFS transporter [Cellvibrionales bacterium]